MKHLKMKLNEVLTSYLRGKQHQLSTAGGRKARRNQSGGGRGEESGAKAKQMTVEHQQTFTDGKIKATTKRRSATLH